MKHFILFLICLWLPLLGSAFAAEGFEGWLRGLKSEAAAAGISAATLDKALQGVRPNELVLKLDRNQPEFKLSLVDYLSRTISPARVRKGVGYLKENQALLRAVADSFGVQPRFLVALWGIETDFGRVTGSFEVIEALATLAYDPRRGPFFRAELLDALHILDRGQVSNRKLQGSWAGAFGGLQFLPSVFRRYAVDFEKDGEIDIWQGGGDLFASGANYLSQSGWLIDQTWGREIRLPPDFKAELAGLQMKKRIAAWQALGVRRTNGADLPARNLLASIVVPDKDSARAFMVYNNFEVLLKWNRSLYYATAVGLLADLLGDGVHENKGG